MSASCEVCGRVAVYHETRILDGTARRTHYCSEHGAGRWASARSEVEARLGVRTREAAIALLRQALVRDANPPEPR